MHQASCIKPRDSHENANEHTVHALVDMLLGGAVKALVTPFLRQEAEAAAQKKKQKEDAAAAQKKVQRMIACA